MPEISFDVLIAVGSVILIGLGAYLGWSSKKQERVEVMSKFEIDLKKIEELALSNREMEVLQLIAKGMSNKEIGEKLFISESTIKTHVSNLFIKLDVKRRTQAVSRAKEMKIIP